MTDDKHTNLSAIKSDNIPLSEKVAEHIIRYIQENQLQKGDRLPNEKTLMQQLNVSRTTIREAMRSLSSRSIVVIRQGSGTYVSNLPGVVEDPLGLKFMYDKEKVIKDLLEIRFIMEPAIASYSAQRASEEDIREILRLSQQVADKINSGQDHIEDDVAFHCKIAQSTGNDVLDVLFPEIVEGVRLFATLLEERIIKDVIIDHERIASAISKRDAMGAYNAMLVHLERNKYALKEYLEQNSNKSEGDKK